MLLIFKDGFVSCVYNDSWVCKTAFKLCKKITDYYVMWWFIYCPVKFYMKHILHGKENSEEAAPKKD